MILRPIYFFYVKKGCNQRRLRRQMSRFTHDFIILCLTVHQGNVVSYFVRSDITQQSRMRHVGPCIIGL